MSRSETDLLQLYILKKEIKNTCKLYSSHRLFINESMVSIFHTLFLPQEDGTEVDIFSLEEIFDQIDAVLSKYHKDTFYLLIVPVFTFLKFEFFLKSGQKQKAYSLFDDLNGDVPSLLEYFNFYTFPSFFLFDKLVVVQQKGEEETLVDENMEGLVEYEPDINDIPGYLNYNIYLATSYFYNRDYEMAARTLHEARNNISFKGLPHIDMEIKLLLGLQYVMLHEFEQAGQLIKSIQRQVRNADGKEYEDVAMFVKMLNKFSNRQPDKAKEYYERFLEVNKGPNRVIPYLVLNKEIFSQ
jgi:tetratricopeptide (TPR) repeat protein